MRHKRRIVRVVVLKTQGARGKLRANLDLLDRMFRPFAGQIDIAVTCEVFLDGAAAMPAIERFGRTGRVSKTVPPEITAAGVSGPNHWAIRRARRLAKSLGSYLILGATERDRQGAIRNVAYLLGRDGSHVGTYVKVTSDLYHTPGNDLPVFETDFGRLGILICADRRWPENARCLRLAGAEIIFNPACGMHGAANAEWMRTRSYENGIPFCFCHNEEVLIAVNGRTAAHLESNVPQVLRHDIDLAENVPMKNTLNASGTPPIQNRRPDLWGRIVT